MIAFFKRLLQYILGLFNSPKPEIQKEEPILYYDHSVVFKKAPTEDRIDDKTIDSYLDSHKKRTATSEPMIKELEADLKKL